MQRSPRLKIPAAAEVWACAITYVDPGELRRGRVALALALTSSYIRSGAETPSSPSVLAIVCLVSRQRPSRACSHALARRPDDLTVAVEGMEVARDLRRVGAEPVRRAARRRLGDLVGQLAAGA